MSEIYFLLNHHIQSKNTRHTPQIIEKNTTPPPFLPPFLLNPFPASKNVSNFITINRLQLELFGVYR